MTLQSIQLNAQYSFEPITDINPTGGTLTEQLTECNGKLYFSARDNDETGYELWVSDGTTSGTYLLKNINSIPGAGSSPRNLTVFNNTLYFAAQDSTGLPGLWSSDGSAGGTQMVSRLEGSPYYLTVANDQLYFQCSDSEHGVELWSYNIQTGSQMVKDINPGTENSYPSHFAVMNNHLYFSALDPVNGEALWMSNGTEAGTVLLKDINPSGIPGSLGRNLTLFSDRLYFKANDGVKGEEIWVSDGTPSGTVLFKDINPGPGNSAPDNFLVVGNKLFFSAMDDIAHGSELWVTDGTEDGTYMVKDINQADASYPEYFSAYDDKLFFRANDGIFGYELWASNGTNEGTYMVKDIYPGSSGGCNFSNTAVYKHQLYFNGTDETNGESLWVTDGTENNTVRIAPASSTLFVPYQNTGSFIVLNDALCINAYSDLNGVEFWKLTSSFESGIQEKTNPPVLQLYPNPAVSHVNLLPEIGEESYTVFSVDGRIMLRGAIPNQQLCPIDVSSLPQGIYLISTSGRTGRFIRQ